MAKKSSLLNWEPEQSSNNHGRIFFWNKGEMAYSAIKQINNLKATNFTNEAKAMIQEWVV